MIKIGLLSDTHGYMDERILHYLEDCDEIWHAGDIGTLDVAKKLESQKPLRAVHGNIDGKDIYIEYPQNHIFTIEGLKVFMTHIGGVPGKYNLEASKLIKLEKPQLFICGHSHILKVATDTINNNMLYLNPGAAGKHGFHKIRTLVKFEIEDGKIKNMRVVELGKRA